MTMMGWDSGWGWGAWLGMSLLMLAFWALVAVCVVAVVRALSRHDEPGSAEPARMSPHAADAREILDARFAHGEIDAEEYTRRRDLLSAR
jgi:putative membrane protein